MEPTLRMSRIEMMPLMMEKSTMGTTMNLTRFKKIVPMGLM